MSSRNASIPYTCTLFVYRPDLFLYGQSVPVSLCPESFDDVPHTWYHTFRYKITILTAWQVHPKSWNRLDGPPERRIHIDPIQCDFGT